MKPVIKETSNAPPSSQQLQSTKVTSTSGSISSSRMLESIPECPRITTTTPKEIPPRDEPHWQLNKSHSTRSYKR